MAEINDTELQEQLKSHKSELEKLKWNLKELDKVWEKALEQLDKIPDWSELEERVEQMRAKVNIAKAMLSWMPTTWEKKTEEKKDVDVWWQSKSNATLSVVSNILPDNVSKWETSAIVEKLNKSEEKKEETSIFEKINTFSWKSLSDFVDLWKKNRWSFSWRF